MRLTCNTIRGEAELRLERDVAEGEIYLEDMEEPLEDYEYAELYYDTASNDESDARAFSGCLRPLQNPQAANTRPSPLSGCPHTAQCYNSAVQNQTAQLGTKPCKPLPPPPIPISPLSAQAS